MASANSSALRAILGSQTTDDPSLVNIPAAQRITTSLLQQYPYALGCRSEIAVDLDWEDCTAFFTPIPAMRSFVVDPEIAGAWLMNGTRERGPPHGYFMDPGAPFAEDEALLLTLSPFRPYGDPIDPNLATNGPPCVLSGVRVFCIPGQEKAELSTALSFFAEPSTKQRASQPDFPGVSVFCFVPKGPRCGYDPIHQDADYHVIPLAPDEGADDLGIADQLSVTDCNNLVARRVLRVDYPTSGRDKDTAYSFLPPCHAPRRTDLPSGREVIRRPRIWQNTRYISRGGGGREVASQTQVVTSQREIEAGRILYTYSSGTLSGLWDDAESDNESGSEDEQPPQGPSRPTGSPGGGGILGSPGAPRRQDRMFDGYKSDKEDDDDLQVIARNVAKDKTQDADFAGESDASVAPTGGEPSIGITAPAGRNTNLAIIPGPNIIMADCTGRPGPTGIRPTSAGCTAGLGGAASTMAGTLPKEQEALLDNWIAKQETYTLALEKGLESAADAITLKGLKAMQLTGGTADRFIQDFEKLVVDFFAQALTLQRQTDRASGAEVAEKLELLYNCTEEFVGAVGRLGNTFKGSALTFSATLKRVEEEIRTTSSEEIAEAVRGYMAGVKEQALGLQNFTDAGPFVAHMLQTVTSHRMHVVMARQRFSAASMELLLAPLVSQGHNAITMASFLQWFARDMHRSVKEDALRKRESETRARDSARIDALEDLERQRHEEAELMRAREKQASMLLAMAATKPGAGSVPSSVNTSKDSGIGSQFSGSRELTPPGALGAGALGAAPQSSPLKRRRKSTPKSQNSTGGTSLKELLAQASANASAPSPPIKRPKGSGSGKSSVRKNLTDSMSMPPPSGNKMDVDPEGQATVDLTNGEPSAPKTKADPKREQLEVKIPVANPFTVDGDRRNKGLFSSPDAALDESVSEMETEGDDSVGRAADEAIDSTHKKNKKKKKTKKKAKDKTGASEPAQAATPVKPGTGSSPKGKLPASKPGGPPVDKGSIEYRRAHVWAQHGKTLTDYRIKKGILPESCPGSCDASHEEYVQALMVEHGGLLGVTTLAQEIKYFQKVAQDTERSKATRRKSADFAKKVKDIEATAFRGTRDRYPTYLSNVFECYVTRDTGERTLIMEDDLNGFAKESMLGLYYLFPHAAVSRYSVTISIQGAEKKKTFSDAFCPFCDFKISKHDVLNDHIRMHLRMFLICRVDGCFHIEQECAAMWNHGTTVHSGKVKKGKPATQKRKYNRFSSEDEAED